MAALSTGVSGAEVVVGDAAPDFTLPATDGSNVSLSDYRGKNNVVLAFFPKAFTGGWTREMKAYQAGIANFTDSDSVVFGVSTDDIEKNTQFAKSLSLEFALLSDATGDVSKKYGIYNAAAKISNRTTFVIDKNGKVAHVESGGGAIDIAGAALACSRLNK